MLQGLTETTDVGAYRRRGIERINVDQHFAQRLNALQNVVGHDAHVPTSPKHCAEQSDPVECTKGMIGNNHDRPGVWNQCQGLLVHIEAHIENLE